MKKNTPAKRLPRVLPDTNPPVFFVEDWEIDQLGDFPQDIKMPFSGFVDEDGKTHFELNVWGWTPEFSRKKAFIWMLRPHLFLGEFFERILKTSVIKKDKKIVAAVAGMYYGQEKKCVIHYLATRPQHWNDLPDGHDVRKRGMVIIGAQVDRLMKWLGARVIESSPCVVPVAKMKKVGWQVKPLSFVEKLKVYRQGFPVSIRRTPRIFVKYYETATQGEAANDNSSIRDRNAA